MALSKGLKEARGNITAEKLSVMRRHINIKGTNGSDINKDTGGMFYASSAHKIYVTFNGMFV